SCGLLRFLLISFLLQHASLSISLCHSFQTRCGFLEYIFGLINPWCSVLQLLLALTQTRVRDIGRLSLAVQSLAAGFPREIP
ncbi:unnamed protein product, partial [Hymenolepis diminuta]